METQTTFLPDTTLDRLVHFAQHEVLLATQDQFVIDTIITTNKLTRYLLTSTTATQDTILTGTVGLVVYKAETNAGGSETALRYLPPELVGQTNEGSTPATYTLLGRNLVLGASPGGSDTLFVYMNIVPRDLSADATKLTVAKEDQFAVALYAAMLVSLRDKQLQAAQLYQGLYQAHITNKRPTTPVEEQ